MVYYRADFPVNALIMSIFKEWVSFSNVYRSINYKLHWAACKVNEIGVDVNFASDPI